MSAEFLEKLMHVARDITGAERCLAVDSQMNVQASHNYIYGVDSSEFNELARPCLKQAIESGQTVLTNNIITDPAKAPVTNTNFSDLRVLVAIPVAGLGAIYLDQHIRRGVIPRETIERLGLLATTLVQSGKLGDDEESLRAIYDSLE